MAGILWVFLNLHEKFFIISLSEDADLTFKKYREFAEIMIITKIWVILKGFSFLWNRLLSNLIYIDHSFGFWITWILLKENPKIESFPPLADLALDNIRVYIYIYIYIFTNLLSTSIHGCQEKEKKNPPGTRDNNISNHHPGEKRKNIIGQRKKKRPTPSHQLKKIKRYAVSWSKEKYNPP